jgi:molecular chaperone IbpA
MEARITTTSPFFNALVREAIGYDPLGSFEQVSNNKYPPHNIAKIGDDKYTLTMAIAGFSKEDLTITVEEGLLTVKGEILTGEEAPEGYEVLYRGIANRDFERSWKLGEYVEVAEVKLKDGMLTIDLERKIPEAKKARTIDIK